MSSPTEGDSFLTNGNIDRPPPNGNIPPSPDTDTPTTESDTPTSPCDDSPTGHERPEGETKQSDSRNHLQVANGKSSSLGHRKSPTTQILNFYRKHKSPDMEKGKDRAETASLDDKALLSSSVGCVISGHTQLGGKRSRSIEDWRTKSRKAGGTSIEMDDTEKFLIGRVDGVSTQSLTNGWELRLRHVRITEVAPTNSSIVDAADDEQSWKVSIDMFSSRKHDKTQEYKKLPQRIRSYYKAQNDLISAYEDIQLEVDDAVFNAENMSKQRKRASILAKATFLVNLLLLVAKAVAVGLSGSMSIISSLVDSAVDLVSGIIIWWTSRAVRKRKPYVYPQGRTRLEPVGIIIVSVVMSLAALQLIVESIQKIVEFSKGSASIPVVDLWTFIIAGSTIVVKLVLYIVCRCYARNSVSVSALSQDHRNDVVSNTGAILFGYLGSVDFINITQEKGVVYIDPVGAILISFYILYNWWKTGWEQIKLLTGHTAKPEFLSKLTWICLNHHREIQFIDTVRAFHFGTNFLVECDVVLPHDMKLKEAHDIGEGLQQKLEKLPEVERAFVHLDYETSHDPNTEHKIV
ncbi:uncharacterized protein LOC135465725 [Liolophura sinensis]|uniref:uncharacterized protein LOC135465725 n=1 Tax=Liolophura sinensis TaxID=3198878 RepID=UPI0031591C31